MPLYKNDGSDPNQPPPGTNYLLIIAIDNYRSPIPLLNNAKNDAMALQEILLSKYRFNKEHTFCLLNEEATTKNLLSTFEQLINTIGKNDNLVLFFAGHGSFFSATRRGYWLLADAAKGDRSTYLNNQEVIDFFNALQAKHVFGIVDSCFSGALFRKVAGDSSGQLYAIPSRWLLTSGRLEPVSDGSIGKQSPFTAALIAQLENRSTAIPVSELCQRVLEGTSHNADQLPRGEPLPNTGHQGGQFVFYPRNMSIPKDEVPIVAGKPVQDQVQPVRTQARYAPTEQSEFTVSIEGKQYRFERGDFKQFKYQLKRQLIENVDRGIQLLQEITEMNADIQNDLLALSGRFKEHRANVRRHLITFGEASIERNRINYAFYGIIDELTVADLKREYKAHFI